jgi:hypothetical protein
MGFHQQKIRITDRPQTIIQKGKGLHKNRIAHARDKQKDREITIIYINSV